MHSSVPSGSSPFSSGTDSTISEFAASCPPRLGRRKLGCQAFTLVRVCILPPESSGRQSDDRSFGNQRVHDPSPQLIHTLSAVQVYNQWYNFEHTGGRSVQVGYSNVFSAVGGGLTSPKILQSYLVFAGTGSTPKRYLGWFLQGACCRLVASGLRLSSEAALLGW